MSFHFFLVPTVYSQIFWYPLYILKYSGTHCIFSNILVPTVCSQIFWYPLYILKYSGTHFIFSNILVPTVHSQIFIKKICIQKQGDDEYMLKIPIQRFNIKTRKILDFFNSILEKHFLKRSIY